MTSCTKPFFDDGSESNCIEHVADCIIAYLFNDRSDEKCIDSTED